jgi:hypothetical protein
MVLALVIASCGGDTTSPTSATTPPSLAAPTSTDGLVSPAAEDCERLAEVELGKVTVISADLATSGSVAGQGGLPDFLPYRVDGGSGHQHRVMAAAAADHPAFRVDLNA